MAEEEAPSVGSELAARVVAEVEAVAVGEEASEVEALAVGEEASEVEATAVGEAIVAPWER